MIPEGTDVIRRRLLLRLALAIWPLPAVAAADELKPLRFGMQPLGYPAAMLGAIIARDRILRAALGALGYRLAPVAFRKGRDMIAPLRSGELAGGLLGDMPTIDALMRVDGWIVGLVKETYSSLVAQGVTLFAEMRGRRIGYVEGSNAHLALLRGLHSVGLRESDVELVPVEIDDMPAALESRRIDGFCAWEPAPTIALARNSANRVIYRGPSSDYFVLARGFETGAPQAALALVAAQIRAVNWMRARPAHLAQAARWAMVDGEAFAGRKSGLLLAQAIEIARRELIDVPSAPVLVVRPGDVPRLAHEFEFLKAAGKLPAGAAYSRIAAALGYPGVGRVTAEPGRFGLARFDYGD